MGINGESVGGRRMANMRDSDQAIRTKTKPLFASITERGCKISGRDIPLNNMHDR